VSEFATEQDPGGYVDPAGDSSYGPGWDEQGGQGGFDPFAAYCVIAGAGSLAWLLLR